MPDSTKPFDGPSPTLPPDPATRPDTRSNVPALNVAPPGYTILKEIGRGGMGVVYLARQARLNRHVALKMIIADRDSPHELLRFLAEADAVAAIQHPNVVDVYECGDHNARPFLVMEFLPGGSLAEKLRARNLAPHEAAELVLKIARGVQAAHDAGVVHRDLKPGNVIFDPTGEPRVCDFGLAKRGNVNLTQTGTIMGTPAYMAPEQARGRTKFVGPQADVYALGVILFECLCGRRPFEDEDPVKLVLKVAEDEPPSVRRFLPNCPRDLDLITLKCLAKEPADRYASAAALALDLKKFLAGDPVSVSQVTVFDRLRSTLARSKNDAEMAAYGTIFLAMVPVQFLGEVVNAVVLNREGPFWAVVASNYGRLAYFLGLFLWFRRKQVFPTTSIERVMWSLWGGYFLCEIGNGTSHRLLGFTWDREREMYLTNALLAALGFFAMAPVFWGWCYAFGAAFLAASVLMAFDLRFAPVEFGFVWATILVVAGLRLRKHAK